MYRDLLEKVVDDFGLNLTSYGNRYMGCCPIHLGADNHSAFNLNCDTGFWFCNTQHCHEHVKNNNIYGFLHALISRRILPDHEFGPDMLCDFSLVLEFLANNSINIDLAARDNVKQTKRVSKEYKYPISFLDDKGVGDCPYFLNRGYAAHILAKHGVFYCGDKTKKLYGLCVVPIFNIEKTKIVGVTCRTPYPKCIVCGGFHRTDGPCIEIESLWRYPKWTNDPYGFIKGNYLYNLWNSWQFVKHTSILMLVESPGNVWKLEQCGFMNSVAVLGSRLSGRQTDLIKRLNPSTIITLTDNDDSGFLLQAGINEAFSESSKIVNINTTVNDISELQDEELKEVVWTNTIKS